MQRNPKLLFFATEDWAFCSHRLPLAKYAVAAGFDVTVITHVNQHGTVIEQAGIKVIPLDIKRGGTNPFVELKTIWQLIKLYKREKPDLLHHIALKPVIYGSIAAKFSRVKKVVNAMTGLGFVFSSTSLKAKILRPMVEKALKTALHINKQTQLIVQNQDDYHFLQKRCVLKPEMIHLIRGSGINMNAFFISTESAGIPVVVLAARMLWSKGVGEFVAAAQMLHTRGVAVRMVLVGDIDKENPNTVTRNQLQQWHQQGVIEWWGKQDDMQSVFSKSHIVCLPSYREGLPRVLLEAAACGRPIITTDAPGCREMIKEGVNGRLIPIQNVGALVNAIAELAADKNLREQYGKNSRQHVLAHFSEPQIIQETMKVYFKLLKLGQRTITR